MSTFNLEGAGSRRKFYTLDIIRGVAAITVLGVHGRDLIQPIIFHHAYLAVDLFFVLSGCVIDHAYRNQLEMGMKRGQFIRLRLIRLYPLYLAGMLVGVIVASIGLKFNPATNWTLGQLAISFLSATLFIPTLGRSLDSTAYPLNAPAWSLFFELLANGIYLVVFRHITTKRLIVTVLLSSITMAAVAFKGEIDSGSTLSGFPIGLLRVTFGFTFGILISRFTSKSTLRWYGPSSYYVVALSVFALCFGPAAGLRAWVWDAVSVLVVFPTITYLGTIVEPPNRVRGLATSMGLASYALYMIHVPILGVLSNASRRLFHVELSSWAPFSGIVLFALLIFLAMLLARWFDVPTRKKLATYFQ